MSANYTKILRSNLVVDTDFGIRQQTEQFYPLTDADWTRIDERHDRLHAGPVPSRAESPQRRAQSQLQRAQRAQLHVRQPSDRSGRRLAVVGPEQPDVDSRRPLPQERRSTSSNRATRKARAASAPGPWAGQFTFSTDVNNPFDTNHSFANALIGSFSNYTEIDAFSDVRGRRNIAEFYVQDTWKATRRLTVDYGVRFLLVHAVDLVAARRGLRARALRSQPRRRGSTSRRASTTSTSRSIR